MVPRLPLVLRRAATSLALLLAACSSSPDRPPAISAETPKPDAVQGTWRARLRMEASGAETFTLDAETRLHLVEIWGNRTPFSAWFFSVSAAQFDLTIPDGRAILFTADLAPGLYRGDGRTYTLAEEGQGAVLGVESNLGSAAYLQLGDLRSPTPAIVRYEEFGEPCTMTVGPKVVTGTVICPSLLDEDGDSVSVRWSWELLPPPEE